MEAIQSFFHTFMIFNINAVYSILFFLKHNYFFIAVLIAIGYMVYQELKIENYNYVDDERRII